MLWPQEHSKLSLCAFCLHQDLSAWLYPVCSTEVYWNHGWNDFLTCTVPGTAGAGCIHTAWGYPGPVLVFCVSFLPRSERGCTRVMLAACMWITALFTHMWSDVHFSFKIYQNICLHIATSSLLCGPWAPGEKIKLFLMMSNLHWAVQEWC